MSKFREELKVIPLAAKLVAASISIGLSGVLFWMTSGDPDHSPPMWFRAVMGLVVPLIWLALNLVIGYVYGDARRRGMRYVMWTLLAIFIPNAIGIILYFILRDPLVRNCPNCGTPVKGGFPFCPKCGAAQSPACPQCRSAIEPDWTHCPRCGAGLRAA